MSYKVDIVIGANYGDEGKGLTTNVVSDENTLIVFASNSAQRSHTVVHNGKRHAFRCFGSGTFKGAATYYSNEYMPNPAIFRQEWEELNKMGIVPKVYINSSCLWVTPMDMYYNTIKSRCKTNSTGCGAWATICRDNYFENLELDCYSGLVGDDYRSSIVSDLELIRNFYAKKVEEDMDIWFYNGRYLISNIIDDFHFMINHCTIIDNYGDGVKNLLRSYNHIVFENSQGLMLDPEFGGYVYTTPAAVGCEKPIKVLKEFFTPSEIELSVYYVTRTYLTRHGDGPMDGIECSVESINSNFIDYTNVYNDFQGEIRYGYFTEGALSKMAERINRDYEWTADIKNRNLNIVITHTNVLPTDTRWFNVLEKLAHSHKVFVSDNELDFDLSF